MIRPRKLLLWLPSRLYGLIVAVRNRFYDLGLLRSNSFPLPVICVGNITVGGTGKTPHVIWLAEKLSSHSRVAILSRGYRRKSRGFLEVKSDSATAVAGDEPLLMAQCLPGSIVYVDRDRVNGLRRIFRENPSIELVLLDDGFQHRAVKAGVNILLTDWNRLMTRDRLLPLGRLREPVKEARRADLVIVTKTPPGLSKPDRRVLSEELQAAGAGKNIFFTTLTYGTPYNLYTGTKRKITANTRLLLVTGIASPAPLADYLKSITGRVTRLSFPDHHSFRRGDIERITTMYDALEGDDKIIITTAKDGVRLKEITIIADHVRAAICVLPVTVKFIEDEDLFLTKIYSYAGKSYKEC